MTTLISPGVDVQVIDESFYASAGLGTVPLIILATAANKASSSGAGIAPYSVPSQAGKLFLATSQRELIQNFGTPTFQSVQGTALHGHELNEYGLLAAYQFLGISNRAYVMRAPIDLAELEPSVAAPVSAPDDGQLWLDLNETNFGVFQSNGDPHIGRAWVPQPVHAIVDGQVDESVSPPAPLSTIGHEGDFAVVTCWCNNLVFEKLDGQWVAIGTPAWKAQRYTQAMGTVANPTITDLAQKLIINGVEVEFTELAGVAQVAPVDLATIANIIAEKAIPNIMVSVYNNRLRVQGTDGGDLEISGDAAPVLGLSSKAGVRVHFTNDMQYPAEHVAGDVWIKGSVPNRGADWMVKMWDNGRWVRMQTPFYPYNPTLTDEEAAKDSAAMAGYNSRPSLGQLYVGVGVDADSTYRMQLRQWNGFKWQDAQNYVAGTVPPVNEAVEGALWYNADLRADIMVSDGQKWQGYNNRYNLTDPKGVIISGSAPKLQSDGTALEDNDLWIDSSDEENYPMLYRYNGGTRRWELIDKTDNTSPFGIVFADARQNSGQNSYMGAAVGYASYSEDEAEMVKSDYVDPDAPNPANYPSGTLLFNTRYSTGNVKEWRPNHFAVGGFDENVDFTESDFVVGTSPQVRFDPLARAGRWVTTSGNRQDGAPHMLRKAQRSVIVRSMAAMLVANQDLRSELIYYNLLAAPGYPELIDEMITLNTDQKEVAFIVGDTPARLAPTGTELQNWATNALNAPSSGEEGLTIANPYVGVYYPWGLTTNLDGMEVMVPPSSIALRTIAYNDNVAYPWYAPAGFRRGLVTNASSVGYLTSENEFKPVLLSQGQRDVLYSNKINPIAFIPNRGLVVQGNKTLHNVASALDRINVARLVNYLKYHLDNLVKPFLFEQNDSQTRDSARVTVERFLNGLVGLRALEDYAVLCDLSNNTPERRERNELWIDIAIKPVHSIEFIYVPVRILSLSAQMPQAIA